MGIATVINTKTKNKVLRLNSFILLPPYEDPGTTLQLIAMYLEIYEVVSNKATLIVLNRKTIKSGKT
jgi:hypothetical protein